MAHSLKIFAKLMIHHWGKCSLAPESSSEEYKSGAHCTIPHFPPPYLFTVLLVCHDSQHMVKSMALMVDPEARQHQRALQSTTQSFIALMRSEDHDPERYKDYIKDIKYLVDDFIPQLSSHKPKDVMKMILMTIKDPDCKYLHPTESTDTSDTDEGMPPIQDAVDEDDIMAEFLKDMLTDEVHKHISDSLEHMEQSHSEAFAAMKSMKKLVPTIPNGALRLLLQAMVQPHIMLQHH